MSLLHTADKALCAPSRGLAGYQSHFFLSSLSFVGKGIQKLVTPQSVTRKKKLSFDVQILGFKFRIIMYCVISDIRDYV